VFGVELDFLLQREAGGEVVPGAVPRVLEQCLSEIEAGGLQEVGLYRIPGASSAINALRQEFDSGSLRYNGCLVFTYLHPFLLWYR
jgi:RhoGAP domain